MRFQDRASAGRQLAERLRAYAERKDVLVLGLPRGGVVVAFEVAQALHLPMDAFVVGKLAVPWAPEVAMGALASDGTAVLNLEFIHTLGIPDEFLKQLIATRRKRLQEQERMCHGQRSPLPIQGKTVLLVDDGLATGYTMRAAVQAVKKQGPKRIIIAVPVATRQACEHFGGEVDEIVSLVIPEELDGVGGWYEDFSQVTDEEVSRFLGDQPEH